MSKKRVLLLAGALALIVGLALAGAFSAPVLAQVAAATDDYDAGAPVVSNPAPLTDFSWPEAVLWDNGPLVNCPGCGVGGADESVLQTSLAMSTFGFGHQVLNGNWVADDFSVGDPAGWDITSLTFFAYQTNSGTGSSMTNVVWEIFDGQPGAGGSVIASGSGLDATGWTNIYRVTEAESGTGTARPIMANTVNVSVFLPQGDYWLNWQADGTLASGPWAPPITINGQTTTGNGLQEIGNSGVWDPALDLGSGTQQGLPFIIEGEVAGGEPLVFCSAPQLPIPDNNPVGVTDTIIISPPEGVGNIGDLNLYLNAAHTWVGDLIFSLEHVDTGTTTVPYDRPGVPASTFGCSGNNIDTTINDEGVDGNLETTCLVDPAIAGDLVGGDPPNAELFAGYDGQSFLGTWELTVSDNGGGDTGTLNEWCLIIEEVAGADPNIFVDPLSMSSTQPPDTQVVQGLDISNTGDEDLEWEVIEDNVPAPPPTAPPPAAPPQAAPQYPPSLGAVPNDAVGVAPLGSAPLASLGSLVRSWNSQNGPYFTIFDLDTPQTLPNVAPFPGDGSFIGAGEFVNGLSYMVDGNNNVYEVDDTGAIVDQYLATPAPNAESYAGMALDPTTGDVYASSTNVATSSICEFDVLTGSATSCDPITGVAAFIALSFDGAGNAFGYDIVTDTWMQVDPDTGATSNVVAMPFSANFGQGLMYDPATGLINILGFNATTFQAELWTVDTSTPAAPVFNFVGVLGSTTPGGLNQLSWGGTGEGGPPLEPCLINGDGSTQTTDIPWLSVNPTGGVTLPGDTDTVDVTFDSTGLAAGLYEASLCVISNDPDPGPGNETNLVIVPVELIVEESQPGPPLACNEPVVGFEEGVFPTDWYIETLALPGGEWVVSTDNSSAFWDPGPAPEGIYYASANDDSPGSGSDGSADYLYTNIVDLSGYNTVSLDFWYHFNGAFGHAAGGVEVSGDGGTTWDGELILPTGDNWQQYSLNLDAYGGSNNVRIRFHSNDGGFWAAGYAIDAVSLACATGEEPDIFVDPLFIGSTQNVNTVTNHPLDIENVGTADLTWDIYEDNSASLPIHNGSYPTSNRVIIGDGPAAFSGSGLTGPVILTERETPAGLVTITHSATQNIVPGNSVSCNNGIGHTDNSYLRIFDLESFGIFGAFDVVEVEIGIESVTSPGGSQPASMNLYLWDDADPFTFANLTPIGSAAVTVFDGDAGTIITVPVAGSAPAGSNLVVEFFTPDGQAAGNLMWVGSNPDGQTSPTYLAAAACGVPEPTDTAAIGFPGMHLVMNVTGDTDAGPAACDAPEDIPWASVAPDNGTTAPGDTDTVNVAFDSTGLAAGTYTAALCVNSNDPDAGPGNGTDLVIVDLELTVEVPTDVSLSGLSGDTNTAMLPLALALLMVLLLGFGLLLRRRSAM